LVTVKKGGNITKDQKKKTQNSALQRGKRPSLQKGRGHELNARHASPNNKRRESPENAAWYNQNLWRS